MATIKFWSEMTKATTVDGEDKVMIGRNATGEAMYADFQYLINQAGMNSSDYIPVDGNTLPDGGEGNKVTFAAPGTYTQSGGDDVVVPENSLGIIVWDGDEWSLSSTIDLSIEDLSIIKNYDQSELVKYPSVRFHKGIIWRAVEETSEEPSHSSESWEQLSLAEDTTTRLQLDFEQGNWTINGKSEPGLSRARTKDKISISTIDSLVFFSEPTWEYKINLFEDSDGDLPTESLDWASGEYTLNINSNYTHLSIAIRRVPQSAPVELNDIPNNFKVSIPGAKTRLGNLAEILKYFLNPTEKVFDLSGDPGDGEYWYKDLETHGVSNNSTSYFKVSLEDVDFVNLNFIRPWSLSSNTIENGSGITFEKEDGSLVNYLDWYFGNDKIEYSELIDIRGLGYKSITLTRDKSGSETFIFEGLKEAEVTEDSVKKYIDDKTDGLGSELEEYNKKLAAICHAYTISPNVPGGVSGVQNRFTFLHFSDVHYGSAAQYTPKENLFQMLDFSERPDMGFLKAIIFTGDACQGLSGRNKQTTIDELEEFTEDFGQSSLPTLTLKGNHDDNANMITANFDVTQALTDEEVHDIMFKPLEDRFSDIINGVEDECYYYADFENEESEGGNIRFIGLNCYDLERVDGGDGLSKYDIRGSYYSQKQIDWLENVLQNTPSDYHVVVLNHGSLVHGYDFYGYAQGWDFIPSVINAWKNGTSFTHAYSNSNFPELDTEKEFDFTSRGQGNFVCYLAGHTHVVEVVKNTYFPDQNAIVVPCLKAQRSFQRTGTGLNGDDEKHPMNRSQNIHEKTAFNCISIDTRYKLLTVTHYGPYRDSMGVYKERTHVLNY